MAAIRIIDDRDPKRRDERNETGKRDQDGSEDRTPWHGGAFDGFLDERLSEVVLLHEPRLEQTSRRAVTRP
jgi:hypothetical protein